MEYRDWLPRCAYRGEAVRRACGRPVCYEGEGPGGCAFLFYGAPGLESVLEDCFARCGGQFGRKVAWLFAERGQILISKRQSGADADTLVLEGLGAGADDVRFGDGDLVEILTKPHRLAEIQSILELEEIAMLQADIVRLPRERTAVYDDAVILRLLDFLRETTALPEVCNLSADFWVLDEKVERLADSF